MSEQGKGRKRSYISIDLKSFYASVGILPHFQYQSVQTRKHQYGRRIPKHAHGTRNLNSWICLRITASVRKNRKR